MMPILALLPYRPTPPRGPQRHLDSIAQIRRVDVSGRAIISGENTSLCLCSCGLHRRHPATPTHRLSVSKTKTILQPATVWRVNRQHRQAGGRCQPQTANFLQKRTGTGHVRRLAAILSTTSRPGSLTGLRPELAVIAQDFNAGFFKICHIAGAIGGAFG